MFVTIPEEILWALIVIYVGAWSDTTPNASIEEVFQAMLVHAVGKAALAQNSTRLEWQPSCNRALELLTQELKEREVSVATVAPSEAGLKDDRMVSGGT